MLPINEQRSRSHHALPSSEQNKWRHKLLTTLSNACTTHHTYKPLKQLLMDSVRLWLYLDRNSMIKYPSVINMWSGCICWLYRRHVSGGVNSLTGDLARTGRKFKTSTCVIYGNTCRPRTIPAQSGRWQSPRYSGNSGTTCEKWETLMCMAKMRQQERKRKSAKWQDDWHWFMVSNITWNPVLRNFCSQIFIHTWSSQCGWSRIGYQSRVLLSYKVFAPKKPKLVSNVRLIRDYLGPQPVWGTLPVMSGILPVWVTIRVISCILWNSSPSAAPSSG